MTEPDISDISDIDLDGFPSDISCDDYSGDSNDSRHEEPSTIEIDMDSRPSISTAKKPTIPPKSKEIVPIKPIKPIITKKSIIKKANTSSIDACLAESNQPVKKERTSSKKETKELKKESAETRTESAADSKFQFNEETVEYFSKDILGDFKKICRVNSSFNNDTALLCLLLKLQVFKEYKCSEKKCKTGKTWLGQPIQLLIHRKNKKMTDLSTSNLELICANCYISKYGINLFIKIIAKTIYKCTYCDYPLTNFTNSKKKERICMSCETKILTSGYFEQRSKFIDQLSDTIDEASTLKKDEFKSSNYYSQVSQIKSFDSTNEGFKPTRKTTYETSKKTFNDKPIIELNLTIPNIDDLICEE